MTEDQHPVDDLLRAHTATPEPSPPDREYAEQKLATAIGQAAGRSRATRRWPAVAWAAGVVAVVAGVLLVLLVSQSTPAEATMEEIAMIVEATDPLTATDTEYIYTRSDVQSLGVVAKDGLGGVPYDKNHLVYQGHSTRETWYGNEGTVQIRTTYHQPSFFNETDHNVYYTAGLDERDRIGETITTTGTEPIEEWPTDPDQLDQGIRAVMVTDRGLPETVEYLDVALDIVGESFASPQTRATTLRLIGRLDGLQVIDTSPDGAATLSIEYTDREVDTRLTFSIDRNGYLRYQQILNITADSEFGIPGETVFFESEVTEPVIADSLDR